MILIYIHPKEEMNNYYYWIVVFLSFPYNFIMTFLFETIGWIATVFGALMFAPQSYKVVRTKSTKELSVLTYTIIFISALGWAIYSSLVGSYQGFVANSVILILMIPMFYYIYDRKSLLAVNILSAIGIITASIIILILMPKTGVALKIILVSISGLSSGFGFVPQVIKAIKIKKYNDGSLYSIILVIFTNILWLIYWIYRVVNASDSELVSIIMASIFTSAAIIFQLPLLYIKLKFE